MLQIQVTYLVMIPMLLSAGLLAASVASSPYYRTEFEKSMIMVASVSEHVLGLFGNKPGEIFSHSSITFCHLIQFDEALQ